jgi:hypothetical protein
MFTRGMSVNEFAKKYGLPKWYNIKMIYYYIEIKVKFISIN